MLRKNVRGGDKNSILGRWIVRLAHKRVRNGITSDLRRNYFRSCPGNDFSYLFARNVLPSTLPHTPPILSPVISRITMFRRNENVGGCAVRTNQRSNYQGTTFVRFKKMTFLTSSCDIFPLPPTLQKASE